MLFELLLGERKRIRFFTRTSRLYNTGCKKPVSSRICMYFDIWNVRISCTRSVLYPRGLISGFRLSTYGRSSYSLTRTRLQENEPSKYPVKKARTGLMICSIFKLVPNSQSIKSCCLNKHNVIFKYNFQHFFQT